MDAGKMTYDELLKAYTRLCAEHTEMGWQLEEARETVHAIRTGQVDALVVQTEAGNELYSLKTADQTYRVFIEKMNEGALTLNESGIILYCNSQFAKMAGIPLSKVIGRELSSFFTEEYQQEYKNFFRDGWDGDTRLEAPIKGMDRLVPCQLSITSLPLSGATSLSVILTDLSYQKEVQGLLKSNNDRLEVSNQALEKSNLDLQHFASVASHDLQEPLRKMEIFSNMLKRNLGTEIGDESAVYLEKIIISASRMKRLISDVLSYTRLDAGRPEPEDVDLNELLAEIAEDFEIVIEEKSAQLEIGTLPVVKAARGQMRQVFQNIISNALKFSKPGVAPHITIQQAAGTEGYCSIAIADNGIGFEVQYATRIFSLFQRLNTKDKYEGSGIGLAVSKKIIEAHRGTIRVESIPGSGSKFYINIPCG